MNRPSGERPRFDIRDLKIEVVGTSAVKSSARRVRRKTAAHVERISKSVDVFEMCDPLLVDENLEMIDGETRLEACKQRGMKEVPVIILRHLSEAQKVAARVAFNRLCEKGEWDLEALADSFEFLIAEEFEFDLEVTGFEFGEIDVLREGGKDAIRAAAQAAAEEPEMIELADLPERPTARLCDRFELAGHIIVCGDATTPAAYERALGSELADLGLTDSPYNIEAERISGKGKIKHGLFIQGSGEMGPAAFRQFIADAATQMAIRSRPGAYNLFFTGWYSMADIRAGCETPFGDLAHMCIWEKTNGGMGFPWRNAWEGILVYRKRGGRARNNVQLGKFGRNRTDVFRYAGANVFRQGRLEELRSHPTCKPVGLLKDIILDVTPIGGIVLDPFLGSGSLILAAHEARRRGVGIELDPRFVDVAIMRVEKALGVEAIHHSGKTFAQLREERSKENR